jgi:hypothetical protein
MGMGEKVHYGYASDGYLGVCGSSGGERRTAIRLVTCVYCQSVIDKFLNEALDFTLAAKAGG